MIFVELGFIFKITLPFGVMMNLVFNHRKKSASGMTLVFFRFSRSPIRSQTFSRAHIHSPFR